jgi:hypothetical protein
MDRGAIPDDEEPAGDVAQQMAQEAHDIRAFVGVILTVHQEAAIGCDGADGGQVIAGERNAQEGGLPARRVRPHHARPEIEARFVHPHDGALLVMGLLF